MEGEGRRQGLPQGDEGESHPQGSKRYPGYGYQLASMPFIGGRTGSVFAKSGSQGKISSIFLFIGGAGD